MAKQRKPIKRGDPPKRSDPPKRGRGPSPVSKAQLARSAARSALVEYVRLRDNYTCQARALVPQIPCRAPLDCHEIIPRSVWKLGYLDPTNVRLVCRNHHDWIDGHPIAAELVGLHGRSWDVPEITQRNACGRILVEYRDTL